MPPAASRGRTGPSRRYLTNVVKRIQDGSYVEIQPTLMGEVFDRWLEHAVQVRVKEGSLKPSTAKSYSGTGVRGPLLKVRAVEVIVVHAVGAQPRAACSRGVGIATALAACPRVRGCSVPPKKRGAC
jgi:hypothetical protein